VAVVSFADLLWPKVETWLGAAHIPPAECQRVAGGLRITRGELDYIENAVKKYFL